MNKKVSAIIIVCITCFSLNSVAQKQTLKPELSNTQNFQAINRKVTVTNNNGKVIVHLDGKHGEGVAWLKNISFTKGIIEFDVKGKNVLQKSFAGIAFHGINNGTFDAVYFRPFNFQSNDATAKKHSVQYISMPKYDWSVLRQTHPGVYENALTKTVEPESWFHAKIIADDSSIKVYVNGDNEPSLVVKPIGNNTKGKIGFWVGNNSEGDFSNLTIKNNE